MIKSIKSMIITGVLLGISIPVSAQDKGVKSLDWPKSTFNGPTSGLSWPVVPSQGLAQAPKAPVAAATSVLKPETNSFFTKISNAVSWCSQKLTSIGNGMQKTSATVYNHRYGLGAVAVMALWQLNKQRIRNNIRAKIERPNIEQCPIIAQRKKEFNWATWRKYNRVANSNNIYASPSDLSSLTPETLLDLIDTDLEHNSMKAFLSNGKESLRLEDHTNNFSIHMLGILLEDIRREKSSLLQDLNYLALELDIDRDLSVDNTNKDNVYEQKIKTAKYLGVYARSIITPNWLNNCITKNYCVTVQDKIKNKFMAAINFMNPGGRFSSLDELNLLSSVYTENLTYTCPRKQFVENVCGSCGLLFSKEAARLYFDVAVAYGRLRALELKIQQGMDNLN